MQRQDGEGGRIQEKLPTKSSWRESGKLETAAGTKLKREKGERRKQKGEGLNSIKTINKGSTKAATPQLHTWRCSGGKGESPEQRGVGEVLGPHGEKRFHCWKDIW